MIQYIFVIRNDTLEFKLFIDLKKYFQFFPFKEEKEKSHCALSISEGICEDLKATTKSIIHFWGLTRFSKNLLFILFE